MRKTLWVFLDLKELKQQENNFFLEFYGFFKIEITMHTKIDFYEVLYKKIKTELKD